MQSLAVKKKTRSPTSASSLACEIIVPVFNSKEGGVTQLRASLKRKHRERKTD